MDVSDWHDRARLAGYDRMVIHDRDFGDAQEVGNFLSVYRRGESWSRWGFARKGRSVYGWCCLTGADIGVFDTVADALATALTGAVAANSDTPRVPIGQHRSVVTELAPRLKGEIRRLGSAA